MKTIHTYAQVIDLLSSELTQDDLSMLADRQPTKITPLHSELNFFTI